MTNPVQQSHQFGKQRSARQLTNLEWELVIDAVGKYRQMHERQLNEQLSGVPASYRTSLKRMCRMCDSILESLFCAACCDTGDQA